MTSTNTGGNCVTLVAKLEGGIEVLITDCEETLSPAAWHLDGRAAGFYVGVHRAELDTDSVYVDLPDQFAYAYSETAPPTAEAIGDLVQEAFGKRDDPVLARPDSEGRPSPCLRSSIRI